MKKVLFGMLLAFVVNVHAQQALKDTQFEGYLIKKGGEKKEVIIEVDNLREPWKFQQDIKFFDKSQLGQKKIKKESCKPGDYEGYVIGTREFTVVEYAGKDAPETNELNAAMGGLKKLSKPKYFAEIDRKGKITTYKFYNSPPEFYVTSGDDIKKMDEFVEKCKREYDILLSKEGEKPVAFDELKIKKFFKECDFVVKKYEDGLYKKKPVKGLGSLIKAAMLSGQSLYDAVMEMVDDYEKECVK
jgi:hypothetical protein